MTHLPAATPRFSLILATLGRVTELDRMLASLAAQTHKDYELIIVDQNLDDRLAPIIERWQSIIPCVRVHAAAGLSKARNAGLTYARGQLAGFPDDDCWYPENYLESISTWFDKHPEYSLLSTCASDQKQTLVSSRWPRQSCPITRASVLRTCTSFCLFTHRQKLMDAGGFDEAMGLGSGTLFQSSEDLDLALRLIERGGQGWFEKSLFAYHPQRDASSASPSRAFYYGAGFGYLLRKHHYSAPIWLYHLLRALGGTAAGVARLRLREASFYWKSVQGRIAGYCHAPRRVNSEDRSPSRVSSVR